MFSTLGWLTGTRRKSGPSRRGSRRAGRSTWARLVPRLEVLEDRTVPSGGLVGNLVIFGDSLSDTGNTAIATQALPNPIPNPDLYYAGRFSNGPIWVDSLAKYLGEPAVLPSLAGGLDYAFGGATVADTTPPAPYNALPRVSLQVGEYLKSHTPAANDLFVVWGGANDFIFGAGAVSAAQSADTLAASLDVLAGAGARQFVVPNLPPLGEAPFFRGTPLRAAADKWAADFDTELAIDVGNFQSAHAGATVISVDVAGLFQQVTQPSNPFGFVNTTDAVGPLVPGSIFLSAVTAADPQDYVFFDGVHPTSKAHQLIGVDAAAGVYDALGVHHLVVTSTADTVDPLASGLSLREMVNLSDAMAGQQTIAFALGTGPHQINLSGKDLSITQDVAIHGPGADKLTISGAGASRIFDVGAGVTAAITGLTIANGAAEQGAGIDNLGALTVSDCAFIKNIATDGPDQLGASGGAILNESGGSLTVQNCTFTANQSLGQVTIGFGGAIDSYGALVVTGSTFRDNVALSVGTNANGFAQALGGAIDSWNGPVAIRNSTFTDNTAQGGGNQGDFAAGGAINLIGPVPTVATIGNCAFTGNAAVGAPGGDGVNTYSFGEGGAVCSSYANLTLTNSTFIANRAVGGAMAPNDSSTDAAAPYGGGLAFFGSLGGPSGGQGTLTLANSTFIGNQAVGGPGGVGGAGIGGIGGGVGIAFGATATITNTTISGNAALGGAGGAGANGGVASGGGMDVSFGASAILTSCTLAGNVALGGAGGAGANGGDGSGGGLDVGSDILFGPSDYPSSVKLTGCTVVGNLALGGEGGSGGNGGSGYGGGLAALFGTAAVNGSAVALNAATGGEGKNGGNGFGGGVYVAAGTTVTAQHSTIAYNLVVRHTGNLG